MKQLPEVTIKKGELYYDMIARKWQTYSMDMCHDGGRSVLTLEEAKKLGLEPPPPRRERLVVWVNEYGLSSDCVYYAHQNEDLACGQAANGRPERVAVRCVELREGEFICSEEMLAKAWVSSINTKQQDPQPREEG
jgi:hypothetical protein